MNASAFCRLVGMKLEQKKLKASSKNTYFQFTRRSRVQLDTDGVCWQLRPGKNSITEMPSVQLYMQRTKLAAGYTLTAPYMSLLTVQLKNTSA